jgi:hypothetical protein
VPADDTEALAHYAEAPALVVCRRVVRYYGPIISGFRLPFPAFWDAIFYGTAFPDRWDDLAFTADSVGAKTRHAKGRSR